MRIGSFRGCRKEFCMAVTAWIWAGGKSRSCIRRDTPPDIAAFTNRSESICIPGIWCTRAAWTPFIPPPTHSNSISPYRKYADIKSIESCPDTISWISLFRWRQISKLDFHSWSKAGNFSRETAFSRLGIFKFTYNEWVLGGAHIVRKDGA